MSDIKEIQEQLYTATLSVSIPQTNEQGMVTNATTDKKMKDQIFIDTDFALEKRGRTDIVKPTDFALACGAAVDKNGNSSFVIRKFAQKGKEGEVNSKIINPHICLKGSALSPKYYFGFYKIDQKSKEDRTITFEKFVWPQKVYSDSFKLDGLMQGGKLNKTGRSFPYAFDKNGTPLCCDEYLGIVDGKMRKFVRFTPKGNKAVTFSDGQKIEAKPYWFEVTPIVWRIDNAKDLIEDLSTRNYTRIPNKTAVEIIPEMGIMSGIPFDETDYYSSNVRKFLNGYENYENNGFLNYAIDPEDTKLKSKFTVVVEDKDLTIDEQLKFYIDHNFSIMLHGKSGVGKSRRVKDIDPDCVMIQLRDGILPEEVIGKTAYNDETRESSWIEPTWYTRIKEVCGKDPKHNHVLFIDEITNVRQYEQSLVYHIVLDRSIDGNQGKLPDNCVVIAAGNDPEESDAASPMVEPLYRRFNAHITLPLDLKDWLEWGSKEVDGKPRIHPLVAAFVAAHHEKVFYTKYDKEKPDYAIDPRGWEQLSNIIYNNNGVIRESLIANKIGKQNAKSFLTFAKVPLISIEDIMYDNYSASDIPTDINAKYALMLSLRIATMEEVGKVREFIGKFLGREHLATFDSLWADTDEKAIFLDRLINPQESEM